MERLYTAGIEPRPCEGPSQESLAVQRNFQAMFNHGFVEIQGFGMCKRDGLLMHSECVGGTAGERGIEKAVVIDL
jgi:hypothetical protein